MMARDQDESDSVYDFLYVDARRIAQFLSQFSQYGHLTGLTRVAGETRSGGGGINVGAAKVDKTTATNEAQTRQFDPQWLNPLTFLDEAQRRDMIVRDIVRANIGQLVLISGNLGVFDVSIFQAIWGVDGLLEQLTDSSTPEAPNLPRKERRAGRGKQPPASSPESKFIKALVPRLPHLVQGSLFDAEKSVWFVLKEDSLVVSQSDLLLKHGINVAGHWNAIGVLDAKPDHGDDEARVEEQMKAGGQFGTLGVAMPGMLPHIRDLLGRPKTAYGITPLLVFREVSVAGTGEDA